MTAADFTADQIVEAITLALRDRNIEAVNGLMHLLAVKDPRRAREVLDTIELGIELGGHQQGPHPDDDG